MTLRAGVSAAVITPPVGYPLAGSGAPATGIDDDLMTRCLVLTNEMSPMVALVSLDVDELPDPVRDEIVRRVAVATGIWVEDVQVATTGNVTSPALDADLTSAPAVRRYTDYLPDIVAGNARMAVTKLQDAAAGMTEIRIPNISCYSEANSREHDRSRLESTHLLAVQDAAGDFVAVVVSNPCPARVRSPSHSWTADYPGALCWMLEQSGIEMPIFVKGDTRGIAPFDWYEGNPAPSHPDHSADDANALALFIATQLGLALPRITPRRNVSPTELLAPFIQSDINAR